MDLMEQGPPERAQKGVHFLRASTPATQSKTSTEQQEPVSYHAEHRLEQTPEERAAADQPLLDKAEASLSGAPACHVKILTSAAGSL